MKQHNNYFEITADSYFDLGFQQGKLFKAEAVATVEQKKQHKHWQAVVEKSQEYLSYTQEALPHLVEELRGYAKSTEIPFDEFWAASLEDEVANLDKCTTIVTNEGKLVAHTEDWDANAQDAICVLKKSINDLTIFELFYYNTLGGNSISINSHGFVHAINSLSHTGAQVGIPHNCIARYMSETSNPDQDFARLSAMRRASGYNHNIVSVDGEVWNIESTAIKQKMTKPNAPFAHTNHYLSELQEFENNDNATYTFERYEQAKHNVQNTLSIAEAQALLSDESQGKQKSIFNERTIARTIFDLEKMQAYIWLRREPEKGWVEYDLSSVLY